MIKFIIQRGDTFSMMAGKCVKKVSLIVITNGLACAVKRAVQVLTEVLEKQKVKKQEKELPVLCSDNGQQFILSFFL